MPSNEPNDEFMSKAFMDNGSDTCGIGGPAWTIDSVSQRKVSISGYDANNTTQKDVPIGTGLTAIDLPDGETIIGRVNKATILGETANSLLSELQLEHNGVCVEKTKDGRRYIEADGYVIPIVVHEAMLTVPIRKPTEQELRTCTFVDLTSDLPWNPEEIHDKHQQDATVYERLVEAAEDAAERRLYLKSVLRGKIRKMCDARMSDWYKFNSYFLYPGEQIMKDTLRHNTRMGKISQSVPMQAHHKSRNPLLTRNRLYEDYATDTVFSSVTSFEGYNCAQPFVGVKSKYRATYGMTTESNGPDAMLDFFRDEGVPISLVRDNSKMQASHTWNEYMRRFWVKDKFTEPYHPQQNPAEREMSSWKNDMVRLMIDWNVDPRGWFKVMEHTGNLSNHKAHPGNPESLPPMTRAHGEVGDITLLTEFHMIPSSPQREVTRSLDDGIEEPRTTATRCAAGS